jgi:cytochrome c biogenesis protein CcmG/thiol:disulfide interchange protein DsbE
MRFLFLSVLVVMAAPLHGASLKQQMQSQGLGVAEKPVDPVEFKLQDLAGKQVALSGLKGKVVLLNFWATWCGPCVSEMPSMQRLYKQLKADGLEILAVNLREEKPAVADFVKKLGLTFPILLDADGYVGSVYNARVIPTTYLVDRNGKIFAGMAGAREWDAPEMVEIFRRILREGTGL